MPVPSSLLIALRRPEPVEGENTGSGTGGAGCRRHREGLGRCRGVGVRDLQARYCRRTIAILDNGEAAC